MPKKELFRKVSLDRLSSPEELDQQLSVTSPIGWLALVAIALLITAGLMWGFLGSIADKTTGEGIIISSGGVINISHHTDGQITGVSVKDGDLVEKGDVIMRLAQDKTVEEINELKRDLEILSKWDVNDSQNATGSLNYRTYDMIVGIVASKLEMEKAELNLSYSLDKYNKNKILLDYGAISQQDFKELEEQYQQFQIELDTKKHVWQQQIKQIELKQLALEQEIIQKQDQLLKDGEIISPATGRVLEVGVKKGDMISPGRSVCTIVKSVEQTESLEAVMYVPVEAGKLIMPGMDVNISPTTVKKEEYGFMLGKVISVSEYPISTEGMLLTLGNQDLVKRLAGDSAPLEVRVNLINDHTTLNGYKWSTPLGPPMKIDSGTICLGEVKVSLKRPISLVVPFLKKILPI